MADDFQAGICSSGSSWWNPARSGGFDGQAMSAAAASVSCSTAIADVGGGFSWVASEMVEGKGRSYDEPVGSASGSSVTFQDTHKTQALDYMVGSPLMDSSLQIHSRGLSPSTMDWTQALLRSSGRAETSFHAMLQEDLSSRLVFRQDPAIDSDQVHAGTGDPTASPYAEMNQSFLLDQHHLSSGDSFQLAPTSYGCPATELQGLFEPDSKPQQSNYDDRPMNYQAPMMGYSESSSELPQPSWPKFPAAPKQQSNNQLHFSNDTQFWNASASAAASESRPDFYPRTQPQSTAQTFEQKPNCSNHTVKSNPEGVRGSSSSSTKRSSSSSSEPALKRPRIETPSPLPTFKVRKEKLGDRITALQQLVSPFGKTDTASVLHEAIEYIKLLHDQVSVLSTPYLKNGHPMQHQQNPEKSSDGEGPKQDLRSRGLCLVPIASTYPMASEALVDFWTPMATFGGSFR